VQPAVLGVEPSRLVDRSENCEVVNLRQLEVLAAAAGSDVDDAGALGPSSRRPRGSRGARRTRPDQARRTDRGSASRRALLPSASPRNVSSGNSLYRDPLAVLAPTVFLVRMHGGSHVRGQRPWSRRPDDDELAFAIDQRETNVERRVSAGPGRRRTGSARAATTRCRSAGTTRSTGGPCRASRGR